MKAPFRAIEAVSGIAGAAICILDAILFSQAQPDQFWPFPGLYLLEIGLAGLAGAAAILLSAGNQTSLWASIVWVVAGILLAFVVLGAFSVGPLLIPATLAFTLAGLLGDLRRQRNVLQHLVVFVLAALVQGLVMLTMVILAGA
jgi:hypothetical protein